jgi:hypothetical protein
MWQLFKLASWVMDFATVPTFPVKHALLPPSIDACRDFIVKLLGKRCDTQNVDWRG